MRGGSNSPAPRAGGGGADDWFPIAPATDIGSASAVSNAYGSAGVPSSLSSGNVAADKSISRVNAKTLPRWPAPSGKVWPHSMTTR